MDIYIHDELKKMARAREEKKEAQDREDKHFTNIIIYIEAVKEGLYNNMEKK